MSTSDNKPIFLLSSFFSIGLVTLIIFGVVKWMGVNPGEIKDWIVGFFIFWWLVVVVTLPWNLYFSAKNLLANSDRAIKNGRPIKDTEVIYLKRWEKFAFILAIALHVLTALVLTYMQYGGFSDLGYMGASAAILLMGFRPAIRAYDYLMSRLKSIGREIDYPADNVQILLDKCEKLEHKLHLINEQLNLEEQSSWASNVDSKISLHATEQEQLRIQIEDLRRINNEEHRKLARDAESAAAQIAEDSKVLNNVREIVRFFKEA